MAKTRFDHGRGGADQKNAAADRRVRITARPAARRSRHSVEPDAATSASASGTTETEPTCCFMVRPNGRKQKRLDDHVTMCGTVGFFSRVRTVRKTAAAERICQRA